MWTRITTIRNFLHRQHKKHSANMGRINNQNFVQIPFSTLIQHIKYKAEEADVQVIIQEESHTSKCSFLDNESFEHHDEYMGKRIKRGIFIYKNGILMHVDLNAVYNMIRKAIPEAFVDGIGGIGLYPRSLSIPEFSRMITSKGGC
ncbi:MAG: zinc ribbon domain-containing protein [Thermoplasmata archaeon]